MINDKIRNHLVAKPMYKVLNKTVEKSSASYKQNVAKKYLQICSLIFNKILHLLDAIHAFEVFQSFKKYTGMQATCLSEHTVINVLIHIICNL